MKAFPFSLCFCVGLAMAIAGCKRDHSAGSDGPARVRIAVIPKGTTHEFWKTVHAGAVKAARELDVDIVWKGPLREDDLKQQIDLVQSFVAQSVSGIVLAPLSDKGLIGSVKAATDARVPVVVFDSDLAGGPYVSFVATDNEVAGKLGADELARRMGTGNVVVLMYQEGSASTSNREKGFLAAIGAHAGAHVISDSQYGGPTVESAEKASENLLAATKADSGGVQGIFTPNESTTFGMLLALRKAGLAGKVHFVGFDASEKLVQAVRSGEIDALVVQRPFDMGYLSIKTMVAHIRGQGVERRIDTGSALVTKENVDSPEIAALVKPDLQKWLGND
jgi:ribose transport system substrate-binding protein